MAHPLTERQKSRAEIRSAAALFGTIGYTSAAIRASAPPKRSAGKVAVGVVAIVLGVIVLLMATGCAQASEEVRDLGYLNRHAAGVIGSRYPNDPYAARLVTGTAAMSRFLGEPDTEPDTTTSTAAVAAFHKTVADVDDEGWTASTVAVVGVPVVVVVAIVARTVGVPPVLVEAGSAILLGLLGKKKKAQDPKS